jgi:hypothetical protein
VIFSVVLILILISIICIPQFLTDNKELNTYILIFLIFLFVFIGIAIVIFVNWQHKQALSQRKKSEFGIYTLERQRNRSKRAVEYLAKDQIELQVIVNRSSCFDGFSNFFVAFHSQKLKDVNANEKNIYSSKR